MHTMLVIAFIALGVSLVSSVLTYLLYRRSGTPLPEYQVGSISAGIGLPLFLAGMSTYFEEAVSIVLLIVGSLLTSCSAVIAFRARRRMRTGGR